MDTSDAKRQTAPYTIRTTKNVEGATIKSHSKYAKESIAVHRGYMIMYARSTFMPPGGHCDWSIDLAALHVDKAQSHNM